MTIEKALEDPPADALERYADNFNRSATLRHFGLTLSFPEGRLVRATLPVRPDQRGGLGSEAVNGGVLAAMFDLVVGSTSALVDPTRRSATVQLSMSFERPTNGDVITADAWIDRAGGSTLFASAVIRDGQGEVTARCQGVVRISRLPWADGASPAIN